MSGFLHLLCAKIMTSERTTTKKEAEALIEKYKVSLVEQVKIHEEWIAELALQHNIDVYLGTEYVDGRQLVLNDDDYHGFSRGEWMSSSQTC